MTELCELAVKIYRRRRDLKIVFNNFILLFNNIQSVTVERTNYSCCHPYKVRGPESTHGLRTPDVVMKSCCLLIPLLFLNFIAIVISVILS